MWLPHREGAAALCSPEDRTPPTSQTTNGRYSVRLFPRLRARWSTASSSNSGDTQHHLLRGEGRVRLEATSPRFLAVADGLPLLQSLAHRWHVGAHPLYLAGANPFAGRSPSEPERGYFRQPVGEDHRKKGGARIRRSQKKVNGRKRHLLVDTGGLVMKAKVHPADLADREGARALLERVGESFPDLQHLWADAGYRGADL